MADRNKAIEKSKENLYFSDAGRCAQCGLRFNTVAALLEHEDAAHNIEKFTAEMQTKFFAKVRKGTPLYKAARQVGTTPGVIDAYTLADPAFARAVKQAEVEASEQIEEGLYAAAVERAPWAVKEHLTKRSPDRWADTTNVKVEHSGGTTNTLDAGPIFDRIVALQASIQAKTPELPLLDLEAEDE